MTQQLNIRLAPLCRLSLSLLLTALTACSSIEHSKNRTEQATAEKTAAIVAPSPEAQEQLNAIGALEQLIVQDPKNPELRYKLALAHLVYAEQQKAPAQRTIAIKHLRQVLSLAPGNVATLQLLYKVYYEEIIEGNQAALVKAHNTFKQLPLEARAELNPPSLAVFLQRFIAQKKSGQNNPTELYSALLAAIHEQPHSDKAYLQLAKMYRQQGYYPLALASLKLATEKISHSQELYAAIATTYEERANSSGCSYDKTAQLKNAIQFYQKAIPLAPNKTELHSALAGMYFDNNLYQLGLHESALSIELDPSAATIANHAQHYSMLGHNQQALVYLTQAKIKGLQASDVATHEIAMNAGRWQEAAQSFTEYLQAQTELRVYDVFKADIIGAQADLDFSSLIARQKIAVHSEWEAAVYAYWTHKMNDAQFKQAARNRCERTEYFFYSGYRAYRAGDINTAKQHFSAALTQNTYRFIERPLARHFLHSIERGR